MTLPPEKDRILLYQRRAAPLPALGSGEYRFLLKELRAASTIIFPEYFAFHDGLHGLEQMIATSTDALDWLSRLSASEEARDTLIVGGSLLYSRGEKLQNCVPILWNGEIISYYAKRSLFQSENRHLTPGSEPLIFPHPATGETWGVMVCADVLLPGAFAEYREADHIAIPTASPWLKEDTPEARIKRDREIYLAGAREADAFVYKSCITGFLSSGSASPPPHVQGRSLVASPKEIHLRAPDIEWAGLLQCGQSDSPAPLFDLIALH